MDDPGRPQATFRFKVEDLIMLEGKAMSPPCYIKNLPWRIMVSQKQCFCHNHWFCYHWLGVFVQCNGSSKSSTWSCYAEVELRLLPARSDVEIFTIATATQRLFCLKENTWGFSHFMDWNELLHPKNGYIKRGAITLEAYIVAYPHSSPARAISNTKKHSDIAKKLSQDKSRSDAVLRYTLPDFSKLTGSVFSPPTFVRNIPWRIHIKQNKSKGLNWLGFYLQCNGETRSTSWFCRAEAELRLLSAIDGSEPLVRKIRHFFYSEENEWGFDYFISFEDVLNAENGYVKDDTIVVEIYLNTDIPQGISNMHSEVEERCRRIRNIVDNLMSEVPFLKEKLALSREFEAVLHNVDSVEKIEFLKTMLTSVVKWKPEDLDALNQNAAAEDGEKK